MQEGWAREYVKYLRERGIKNTYFWSYNPDSGDTRGVLMEDCVNVNNEKMGILRELWSR